MGGAHGKEKKNGKLSKKSNSSISNNLNNTKKKDDKMKDDYVKFIMREQLRREKEFKDKCNDRDNIYN